MYRAIIVDDEIWALRGLNNIISWNEFGFEISKLCMNVEEALDAIDEYNPDIIFTDIRMPFLSGMDLLDRINASDNRALTVIVSAYRDFDIAKRAIVHGVFAYLVKPLEREEIITLVKRAKNKLDERRDEEEIKIDELDLSDEKNLEHRAVQQMLKELAPTPECYLIIGAEESLKQILSNTGELQKIYMSGYQNTCLYCGDIPESVRRGNVGISIKHDNFNDFSVMFDEAVYALKGDFFYSENKLTASIQFYLAEDYKKKINLKELAEKFFISEPYLYELFKKNTDTTVTTFLKKIRLKHAVYLLTYTDESISDIAGEIGYDDAGYFGRLFRKEFNCSPEAYRRKSKSE